LYDLIIGKQTLHDIGAVLDFKEKTYPWGILSICNSNLA
jgi:septin family protein